MAKRFLLLLFLIAPVFTTQAQEKFEPEMSFGVNAGVSLSRVSFTPTIPQDLLIQGAGGISFRYITEKHFGLQVELNYSMRGWKETRDTSINENIYDRSLSYIELPIMSHFYIDISTRMRVVFFVGPQFSYLLSEKELNRELAVTPETATTRPYYYDKELDRSFEYGIVGGLGLEMRTRVGNFVLDGRFFHSLHDIYNNGRGDLFQKSLNMVFGVKLTYLIKN